MAKEKPVKIETPQLLELLACQNKIRKMRHELRCLGEAHQRTIYSLLDTQRHNLGLQEKVKRLQAAYEQLAGVGPGWLKRTIRGFANVLFNIAR